MVPTAVIPKKKCGNPSKSIPVKSTVKWVYHDLAWFINLVWVLNRLENTSVDSGEMAQSQPNADQWPTSPCLAQATQDSAERHSRPQPEPCKEIEAHVLPGHFGTHKWAGIRKAIKLVQDQVLHPTSQISFPNRRYKLTWLWKITIFNRKTHCKWQFSIAILVYQRVIIVLSTWTKGMPVRFWAPNPLKEELAQTRLQSTFPSHPGKRSRKRFHWETARAVTPKLAQTCSNVWKAYAWRAALHEGNQESPKEEQYLQPPPSPARLERRWNVRDFASVL